MNRDIDQIIDCLKSAIPGASVAQLLVKHPGADDNGLWFITMPGITEEIQIESPAGMCPFLVESAFSSERFHGHSVSEVVEIVASLIAKHCTT